MVPVNISWVAMIRYRVSRKITANVSRGRSLMRWDREWAASRWLPIKLPGVSCSLAIREDRLARARRLASLYSLSPWSLRSSWGSALSNLRRLP